MKRYLSFFFLVSVIIGFATCSNDDDNLDKYQDRKVENEVAFAKIVASGEYTELKSPNGVGSIYYKVLKEGTGTERIFWTSTISAYYTGWYINGEIFDEKTEDQEPEIFTVINLIEGWRTALEVMKEGDKWEIWVPYYLGFGAEGKKVNGAYEILPYSTLHFVFEVVELVEQ